MNRLVTAFALIASIVLLSAPGAGAAEKGASARAPGTVARFVSGVRKAGEAIRNEAAAVGRGIAAAPRYQSQAFASEKTDRLAHEKAAAQWGREVGNARVAGTLRAAAEMGQAVYYTGQDIRSRVTTGQPGPYQPYTREYVADAMRDVKNAVEGARGTSAYLTR